MEFKLSFDRLSKWITTGTLVVFLTTLGIIEFVKDNQNTEILTLVQTLMATFLTLILGYCYFTRPLYYYLDSQNLVIRRPINSITIPRIEISESTLVEHSEKKNMLRLFGNGGFFGYTGFFYNHTLGKMHLYVSRKDHWVLIKLSNKKQVVLSPDEDVTFLRELQSM